MSDFDTWIDSQIAAKKFSPHPSVKEIYLMRRAWHAALDHHTSQVSVPPISSHLTSKRHKAQPAPVPETHSYKVPTDPGDFEGEEYLIPHKR
jgi:hypothetical protein